MVTTTGMIGDIVKNLVDDSIQVQSLMGSGIDPHVYKATQGDLKKFEKADVIFYNGLHLEGKMAEILGRYSMQKPAFAVGEVIADHKLLRPAEYAGQFDPHIWFNVQIWAEVTTYITGALKHEFPAKKEIIEQNSVSYQRKLQELHEWVEKEILSIPEEQRILITAHDAFGYFGAAYGIEVMALQGVSTATEYGLHDVKRLSDIIIKRKVKAVFVESSVPKRFLISLQEGVIRSGHDLAIGGELYSDAMGVPGSGHDNYIAMVKHNVETIVSALK